jgi:lipopolysaccharide biosynthesis regulator YciM
VYRALARDYLRTDRKVKAISVLEELLRSAPGDVDSGRDLLGLYIETGSWEKAQELLRTVSREAKRPRPVASLYAEFACGRMATDPKAALAALNEALRLDRKCLAARVYLGDLQLSQRDADAAVKTWTELLDVAPEQNALVRERMEHALFELGRYDEVTGIYEKLLRRVPDDVGLTVALAGIYSKMERPDEAIRLLQRAAASPRTGEAARLSLAELYLAKAEYGRARALLTEASAKLAGSGPTCRHCHEPLQDSLLRCAGCRGWQEPAA